MLIRLHHVLLAMPRGEEEAARRFYVDLLEMDETEKPATLSGRGGAWFRSGDVELHLGVEEAFRPARKAHPGLVVDDVDALAERFEAAGVAVTWDDGFPGHRRIYADDPFGNRLEFLQPLG